MDFLKMHGLGNDFVVIDGRTNNFLPDAAFCLWVADRRRGVGCDQLIILGKPQNPAADVYVHIYNKDASRAGACGNAMRCIATLLFKELNRNEAVIETISGLLPVNHDTLEMVAVDFGKPRLEWNEIPLSRKMDTLNIELKSGSLSNPCCVNMGNPHAVFFVNDVKAINLVEVGPKLETDALFPERANIEIVQILAPDRIRMRVWERGAGITEACGSGACAVLVAAVRRGLAARRATIILDGGELIVEWRQDDHVILIGPSALSYRGTIEYPSATSVKLAS